MNSCSGRGGIRQLKLDVATLTDDSASIPKAPAAAADLQCSSNPAPRGAGRPWFPGVTAAH
jgi:hypothetical protein